MQPFTRRRFLQYGAGVGGALGVPWACDSPRPAPPPAASSSNTLNPCRCREPESSSRRPARPTVLFTQTTNQRQLHPQLPPTPVWAYDDGSGLGGQAGSFGWRSSRRAVRRSRCKYTHNLPRLIPSWIPVDTRLTPLGNQVRLMTHLHGGFVAADSDGNPAITPTDSVPARPRRSLHESAPQMPASLLWFHDHGLGATRLNVFAGLAAAYIVRDAYDTGPEPNPIGIPGGAYEIPLVVQDRQFNADGTFRYPVSDIAGVTGSASTSAMSCWSTARCGRTSTSSRGCTGCESSTAAMRES